MFVLDVDEQVVVREELLVSVFCLFFDLNFWFYIFLQVEFGEFFDEMFEISDNRGVSWDGVIVLGFFV